MTNINKPLFSRKVKCKMCGKNMKGKLEKGVRKYVCSSYDNYSLCQRTLIEEKSLRELIEKRHRREMSNEEISEIVDKIIVEDKHLFEIHLKNSDKPIIFGRNFIQF
ncbi:zinc ribbon domain-containing protein [Siminovitchia fordii]|uniref:Recombinase zinc beta ribbon domain-containing protein n=1 Tax=Siminovitchia fordii TaxID=254759 RepID=A0ABQ4KBQ3_9BACI|nr:zinc ribbon domain-containing protein [Siminovitchia fordii]GIN23142.1 hypothetical protein J1TS3_42760 [Siminovitchia fordii]